MTGTGFFQFGFAAVVAAVAFGLAHSVIFPLLFGQSAGLVTGLSLEEAIRELKSELTEVANAPGAPAGLSLQEARIELFTQRDTTHGQDIELAVPVFDEAALSSRASNRLTNGSKITIRFVDLAGESVLGTGASSELDLSELVLAARQALLATLSERPPLVPASVEIEISFVLVAGTTAEATIKAHVVSIGQALGNTFTEGNKIVLTYRNPAVRVPGANTAPVPPI